MKEFYISHGSHKYLVRLDQNGEPYSVAVEMSRGGSRTFTRRLWNANLKVAMPQRVKDVLNSKGVSEQIAYLMGWGE